MISVLVVDVMDLTAVLGLMITSLAGLELMKLVLHVADFNQSIIH
jgi:hypothetical protein